MPWSVAVEQHGVAMEHEYRIIIDYAEWLSLEHRRAHKRFAAIQSHADLLRSDYRTVLEAGAVADDVARALGYRNTA